MNCPCCKQKMERRVEGYNFYHWVCDECFRTFTDDYLRGFEDGQRFNEETEDESN